MELLEEKKLDHCSCSVCWTMIPTQVMMCPDCSALFCVDCHEKLPKQGSMQRCSSCRQASSKFVRCRGVEKIIAEKILERKERCQTHNLEENFFCIPCKAPFCPKCILKEGLHAVHELSSLKKVYLETKPKLEKDIGKSKEKFSELVQLEKLMNEKIKEINV